MLQRNAQLRNLALDRDEGSEFDRIQGSPGPHEDPAEPWGV